MTPRDFQKLARACTTEALDTIKALMRDGDTGNVKLAAANALLDRGWGKPVQNLDLKDADRLEDVRAMSRDQLLTLVNALAERYLAERSRGAQRVLEAPAGNGQSDGVH